MSDILVASLKITVNCHYQNIHANVTLENKDDPKQKDIQEMRKCCVAKLLL